MQNNSNQTPKYPNLIFSKYFCRIFLFYWVFIKLIKDKQITNGELLAYMGINVSQKALELGRQQNPSLAGDPNQVLMKYW